MWQAASKVQLPQVHNSILLFGVLPRQEARELYRVADDATKLEMQRMVQRYNDFSADEPGDLDDGSDTDEEDGEAGLAERLDGIDLDDEDVSAAIWSRLTESERNEFLRLIDNNEVDELLVPWKPWWTSESGTNVVEASDDRSPIERVAQENCGSVPAILKIGTPVQQLTKKVHPSVLFQIAQTCLSYVFMMRHLNGDPRGSNSTAALSDVFIVSPLLASKEADIYESLHEALIVGFFNIGREEMRSEAKCALLDDVLAIYARAEFVAAMMSDLYGLVSGFLSTDYPCAKDVKRSMVRRAEKRLYFLYSIVLQLQHKAESWQGMVADITLLRRRYESESKAVADDASNSARKVKLSSSPSRITEL
ncbi:Zinc finger HIT domain-containing protein 2 [Coemansia sp. RSA 2675]|nr:Zinc finger HIT domain-containing protein 2 [Coemansia sp. RSA 2675]